MVCALPPSPLQVGPAAAPELLAPCDDLPSPEVARRHVVGNRYLPEEQIEQGPLGVTYEAYDIAADAPVWIQFFRTSLFDPSCPVSWDAEPLAAVRQSIAKLARLGHPHILEFCGRGVLDHVWPFVVTAPYRGPTLRQRMDAGVRHDFRQLLSIGRQLAAALEAAHGLGVLHTALSPEQVVVRGLGADVRVELAGLGLAPLLQREREARAPRVQEPGSSALPGQVPSGRTDERSDVHALGVLLRELCTEAALPSAEGALQRSPRRAGRAPEPSPSRSGIDGLEWRVLDQMVRRCLAPLPECRYASMAALDHDLARLERAWAKPRGSVPAARSALRHQIHRPPRARAAPPRLPKVMLRT